MRRWKVITAGCAAAGVVVLGGGVAYGSATTTASAPAQAKDQNGHRLRPPLRRVVHGTVTVRTRKGFKPVSVQRGTVTSASATRLTVTSPDTYTRTYTMNADTRVRLNRQDSDRNHVAKGQHVRVVTSPRDGTSVARRVALRSK